MSIRGSSADDWTPPAPESRISARPEKAEAKWQGTDSRRGSGLSRRRGLKTGVAFQVAGQIRGGRNVQ